MASNRIEQAYGLAGRHHIDAAVAALEDGGSAGDAECLIELALWNLGGRFVPRNLGRARDCFGRAGALGNAKARMIHLSLLASGIGGPANWEGAIDHLRAAAQTDPAAARQIDLLSAMNLGRAGNPLGLPPARPLSESPKASLFPNLLSQEECQYLIDLAGPALRPSVVVDPVTGQMQPHPVRTSENAMFPWVDENPVIHAINRRIAAASGTDVHSGEPLQVLRYLPGQQYRPHHDAIPNADNQRVMTMLVYLNDDYAGGETQFLSTGLQVKGAAGDALLFHNSNSSGQPDPMAEHAGLPVTSGQKLLASRWIHERRFGPL
jgi:prolyl 4-hydroxylase